MIFYKSPDKASGYNYEGTEPSLRGQVWKNEKNNIQQSMEKKRMRQKVTYLNHNLLSQIRRTGTGESCTKKEKYTVGIFFINYSQSLVSVIRLCYSNQ